ncbi:MAG: flippase [candidate division WOR-3 bacterium]|nr:MAG: flippase [candidate division WOR-3 bacterium]
MKKISRNFLSLFFSDGITRIIGFAATVYIARVLAVEGFGLINYGLAFISYALLFANPGLTIIGAREVAKDPKDRAFIEQTLGLRLFLAVVIFVVFATAIFLLPGEGMTKQIILIYSATLFPFAILLEFVFQGREEMEYIGAGRILQYVLYLLLLLLLVRSSLDLLAVPFSFVLGYAASAIFLLLVYIRKYRVFRPRFSILRWRAVLTAAIPVGLAIIFNQVTISLPPIVLGLFRTNYEVGIFSAGYKIIFTLLIIERVFYYVFFPVLSRDYAENPAKLKSNFSFLTRFLFALTIPLALGGLILAPGIINIVYGPVFSDAATVLRILLLYFMIVPVNTIYGYGLIAMDREKRFFRIIAITAVVSTVLIILLGLRFGVYGAAVALLVSEAISISLMRRELQRVISFGSLRYVTKPVAASLLMIVVLYVLRQWHSIVLIVVGACIYVVLLYLFRGFSVQDLKSIARMFVVR